MSVIAMRRHKDDAGYSVTNIAELDNTVRLIGKCDMEIEREQIFMNEELQRIKNESTTRIEQVKAHRATLIALCQTFVTAQREALLQGRKTAQLTFGKLGFRRIPAKIGIPPKNTDAMEDLCDRIITAKATDGAGRYEHVAIHVRRYVDMEDLKQLTDAALAQIELERSPAEDQFFVQPDLHKIAEMIGGISDGE